MSTLQRRFLRLGFLVVIMLLIGLFGWRYHTINAKVAHPAVNVRTLKLPAKVGLNQKTAVLEKVEARVVHGKWRVQLHFDQPLAKQSIKHMRFQIEQQRQGRKVANESVVSLSRNNKVLTMTDSYYSQAKFNRVIMVTLPQALHSQNRVQLVPFKD